MLTDALQTLADEPDPIKARLILTKRAASAADGRCTPFIFHEDFKSDFNTNCFHHVAQRNRLYCGLQSGELLEVDLDNGQVHNRWKLAEVLICGIQFVPSTGRLHVATKALEMLTVDPDSGAVLKRTRLAEGVSAWRLLYVEQLGSLVCGLNTDAGTVTALDGASMAEQWCVKLNDGFALSMCKHADCRWLYALTRYCNVHCIDPAGGDVLWTVACGETHPFAFSIKYVPELQRVYASNRNGELIGLDSRTGSVTNTLKMPTARGIVVMEYVRARCVMYVGIFSGELIAVDLCSCNLPLHTQLATHGVARPAYVAATRTLYVPADGDLCAVRVQTEERPHAPCLELIRRRTLHTYVVVSGADSDAMLRGLTHVPAAAASDELSSDSPGVGVLYAGTGAGELVAIDPLTLEVTMRVPVVAHKGNRVMVIIQAACGETDSVLFVGTGNTWGQAGVGEVCAFDIAASPARELWRFDLGVGVYLGCLAHMPDKSLAAGVLVAGTKCGELVAIDAATGALRQRRMLTSGTSGTTYIVSVLYVPEAALLFVLMNTDAELLALRPESWEVRRRIKLGVGLNTSTGSSLNWNATARHPLTGACGVLHVGVGCGDIVHVDASLTELARVRVGLYDPYEQCQFVPELGRLFVPQRSGLLSEPVAFDALGYLPGCLRKRPEQSTPWMRMAKEVVPASCGGGTALHASAFLDLPELTTELLAVGTPLWTRDTHGHATALEVALERRSFRALKVLIAAAASTPGMADCILTDSRWAVTIARLAEIGEAATGALGGLMAATTRELLGATPTHASISTMVTAGAEWPRLGGGQAASRRGWGRLGCGRASVVHAHAGQARAAWPPLKGDGCKIVLRCVAIPGWARCQDALDAVIESTDDSFVASTAVQALIRHKWTSYARLVLFAQALLHYGTLLAVSLAPSHGVTKVLLALFSCQVGLSGAAQLVRTLDSSSTSAVMRHLLNPRELLHFVALAAAILALASFAPADPAVARWLRSVTKLVWWLRGIYFLRIVGQLSAMLRMMQAIVADVAAFMFLLTFAMVAMTSTLGELELFAEMDGALWGNGQVVPFATFFRVYEMAVFGSSLPVEFRMSNYEFWAIGLFFAFSFVGFVVMMNFLIAVMADTFERVQERAQVLSVKESATLIRDVDAFLPRRLLARLNPLYVLYAEPAVDVSSEWSGFFGEIRREVRGVTDQVRSLDSGMGEMRDQLRELSRMVSDRLGPTDTAPSH